MDGKGVMSFEIVWFIVINMTMVSYKLNDKVYEINTAGIIWNPLI
jgi:hypothetical protein